MKILLKKDIPDLGAKGEIKDVKPGYYYNYLFPQGLAIVATEKVIEEIREKKKKRETKKKRELKTAQELKKKLEGREIRVEKSTTKKKLLYAQVKPKEIIESLEKQLKIKKDLLEPQMIILDSAIKRLGSFKVKIELAKGLEAMVKLLVVSKE